MREFKISILLLLMIFAVGWNASAAGSHRGDREMEGRLSVERIQINVIRSDRPRVFVRVRGSMLACAHLGVAEQEKKGHKVIVTIPTHTPQAICPMMARLIDETIRLEGDFGPGSYTLEVNGVVEQFTV